MPIYEYVCKSCGHELESLQSMSEDPLKDCPACGEPQLRRKISAAGFRLGGKGWYETDFKTRDKQRNVAGERKPETASKDKDTKSDKSSSKPQSDSKPAKGSAPAG